MTTIRDVARHAGVSTATVSHVLNGTRTVLPETRALVMAAIEQLNYRPSALARSLTTNTTKTVGVVIADVLSPFFSFLLRDIEDLLSVQGYNLIVCNTYELPDREAYNLEMLLERRVDGVILTPTGVEQPIYEQFNALNIPLVFVDRNPPKQRGGFVGTDNFKAAYEATRYLLALGHQRIALVSLIPETSAVSARINGYTSALEEAGIAADPALIRASNFEIESACAITKSFFELDEPPTALIAGSHTATLGALKALSELELRYPDDISLVCFDNSPWTGVIRPALTVSTKPIAELARAAVAALLSSMNEIEKHRRRHEPPPPLPLMSRLLGAQLVVRDSCSAVVTV